MALDIHKPELSTADLLACVPGLSSEVFKQWQARGHMVPREAGPGKGGRRRWSPAEVIQAATIFELARQGIFPSKVFVVCLLVQTRLSQWVDATPDAAHRQLLLLTVNHYTGDLDFRPAAEGAADWGMDQADSPDGFFVLRTDRIIERVLGRIEALLSDNEMPPAPNPSAGAETPEDFLLLYEKDAAGRKVRTGLTLLESAELEALTGGGYRTDEERRRYRELFQKHERARLQRIAAVAAARDAGKSE